MLNAYHTWMAVAVFAGVIALPALYLYAVAARQRRRRLQSHLRQDALRRRGA